MKLIKICWKAIVVCLLAVAILLVGLSLIKGRDYVKDLIYQVTGKIDGWDDRLDEWGEKGEELVENGKEIFDQVIENYTGFDGYDIEDADTFNKEYEIRSGNVEQVFHKADISYADIELGGCLLDIMETSDESIRIVTENIGRFQAFQKEGKLFMKAARGAREEAEECRICLYLPAGYRFQEMDLEVGAGQIQADRLDAAVLNLEVGAGQIGADSVRADQLNIAVGAGSISLGQMLVGLLEADVDAGRLQADGRVLGNIIGECAVGSLELQLIGTKGDYNYLLDCAAGNIYLDGEKHASGLDKEIRIDNGAEQTMELECAVGTIKINFNQ